MTRHTVLLNNGRNIGGITHCGCITLCHTILINLIVVVTGRLRQGSRERQQKAGKKRYFIVKMILLQEILFKTGKTPYQFSGAPAAIHTRNFDREQSSSFDPPRGIQLTALVTEL